MNAYALSGKPVELITHDAAPAAVTPPWVWSGLAGLAICAVVAAGAVLLWRRRRARWRPDPRDGVLERAAGALGLSADQVESLRMESFRRGLDHPLGLLLTPGHLEVKATKKGLTGKKAPRRKTPGRRAA